MPGTKRKIDEDTWIVSQSKKFKQGILLSNVYETTLAHLRLGARNFFHSLMGSSSNDHNMEVATTAGSSSLSTTTAANSEQHNTSPYNTPPGSPVIRDIITDSEIQSLGVPLMARPTNICRDCVSRSHNPLGNEDLYGKCAYCDKLVCHLNVCRDCGNNFCAQCSITKYDYSSETYECYSCLH